MERHHYWNHAIHDRQFTGSNTLTNFGKLPEHIGASTRAGIESPDLAVIGAHVGQQNMHTVLLISGKSAFVVIPERRTDQCRRRTADRSDGSTACGQGLLKHFM